jgi:hypothetical protein
VPAVYAPCATGGARDCRLYRRSLGSLGQPSGRASARMRSLGASWCARTAATGSRSGANPSGARSAAGSIGSSASGDPSAVGPDLSFLRSDGKSVAVFGHDPGDPASRDARAGARRPRVGIRLTAVRPSSASGWRTVVSAGVIIEARSASSNPITDRSSGTDRSRSQSRQMLATRTRFRMSRSQS